MARIAFCGLFGVGNLGNEGSLQVMIQQVRRMAPDAVLHCICPDPEKVLKDHGIAATRLDTRPARRAGASSGLLLRAWYWIPRELISWWRTFAYLRQIDVLLFPGTGILDDFGLRPFQVPYDIFRWCFAARLYRRRVLFVSIGAGPIRNRVSRWLMKASARLAHYRSYRDGISRDFMRSIGVPVREDAVYPDLVFGLEAPDSCTAVKRNPGRLVVGVGVMSYYGWSDDPAVGEQIYWRYISAVGQCAQWLLSEGMDIILLVGDTQADQRAVSDVLKAVALPTSHSSPPGNIYSVSIGCLTDLFLAIAGTDVVVATRFHNVVMSLMLGKAVVSCGYAEKNAELLKDVGLAGYSQAVEALDVELLKQQIKSAIGRRAELEEHICYRAAQYKESLETQMGTVRQYL